MERLSEQGAIDLWYGDAARVSVQPCVPYGWQFADEDVFMPATQGAGINCFAFLQRHNACRFTTTRQAITSQFVCEQLEQMSLEVRKLTVVVLDNAPVHRAAKVEARRGIWQQRGLSVFYLPRYSPHLNIVEILWHKVKYEWLSPKDYETTEGLFYTVRQILAAVGTSLTINFSKFALA